MNHELQALVRLGHGDELRDQRVFGLEALAIEIESRGADAGALFAGTGITRAALRDPGARVSRRERLRVFGNARRLCPVGDAPDLGLRAGERQHLGSYGMYGFGLSAHATAREALAFGLRYLSVLGPVMSVRSRDERRTLVLRSEDTEAFAPLLPFVIELWRSSFLALMARASGAPLRSRLMRFAYDAPANVAAYGAAFDCPLEFGAPHTEWHLDVSGLEGSCPNASAVAASLCESWCETVAPSAEPARATFGHRVRASCLDDPSRIPSADEMAARLRVSRRTFHRRLAGEQTSYQQVIDRARERRALELLGDPALTLDRIGAAVGFTEATNFRKAFRRWTGMTPSDFRAQRARS